jgi:hypothetical protein
LCRTCFENAPQCFSCVRLQVDALEREVENAREVERKLENKLMEVLTDFVIILHVLSVHSDAGGRLLPQVWDSFQIPVQAGNFECYLRRSAFLLWFTAAG